jgi:predicted nuclease with TOPRIM domain
LFFPDPMSRELQRKLQEKERESARLYDESRRVSGPEAQALRERAARARFEAADLQSDLSRHTRSMMLTFGQGRRA